MLICHNWLGYLFGCINLHKLLLLFFLPVSETLLVSFSFTPIQHDLAYMDIFTLIVFDHVKLFCFAILTPTGNALGHGITGMNWTLSPIVRDKTSLFA